LDDNTGLYYYNARYYDPEIGRFISPDTIVPNPANPQSLNRYSYCLNNPLKYIDPSGHGGMTAVNQGDNGNGEDWYIIYDEDGNIIGITTGYDSTKDTAANIARQKDYDYVDIQESLLSEHPEYRISFYDNFNCFNPTLYHWELDRSIYYPFSGGFKDGWVKVKIPTCYDPIDWGAVDWRGMGRGFVASLEIGIGIPLALIGFARAGLSNNVTTFGQMRDVPISYSNIGVALAVDGYNRVAPSDKKIDAGWFSSDIFRY